MRKKLWITASALLMLVGCGSTNDSLTAGEAPKGGTKVETRAAAQVLESGVKSMDSADKLGFSFKAPKVALKVETSVDEVKQEEVSFSGENLEMKAGISGLKSATSGEQVKGSLSFSGNLSFNLGAEEKKYSGLSCDVYLAQGNFYVDVSNSAVQTLLGDFGIGEISKFYLPIDWSGATFPLLEDGAFEQVISEIKNAISGDANENVQIADLFQNFLSAYSYDNGDYVFTVNITKDGILDVARGFLEDQGGEMNSSMVDAYLETVREEIEASGFDHIKASLKFSDAGISELSCSVLMAASASDTIKDDTGAITATMETKTYIELNAGVSFFTGDAVTVKEPLSVADYTLIDLDGATA